MMVRKPVPLVQQVHTLRRRVQSPVSIVKPANGSRVIAADQPQIALTASPARTPALMPMTAGASIS